MVKIRRPKPLQALLAVAGLLLVLAGIVMAGIFLPAAVILAGLLLIGLGIEVAP